MKFLTGLCQDDVTTSSDDVVSRKTFRVMCGRTFLVKSPKEFWKSVMVQELRSKKLA